MAYFLQQLVNALPVSAEYALLSFAYAVAFAMTRRADITQGALFAFAGQIFVLSFETGWNKLVLIFPAALAFAVVVAIGYTAGAGFLVSRHVIQPMLKSSRNAMMVGTLGVLLILMETARLATNTRELWVPPDLTFPVRLMAVDGIAVTMPAIQMFNVVLFVILIIVAGGYLHRSTWGRNWKAVRDDRMAAALCGIASDRIVLQAYLAAAILAAVAGISTTIYYGTMDFGAGLTFGLKVVMIAAVGGYTHPWRSALGGMLFGFAETFWGAYGPLFWRDLVMFSALVILLVLMHREKPVP